MNTTTCGPVPVLRAAISSFDILTHIAKVLQRPMLFPDRWHLMNSKWNWGNERHLSEVMLHDGQNSFSVDLIFNVDTKTFTADVDSWKRKEYGHRIDYLLACLNNLKRDDAGNMQPAVECAV